MAKNVRSPCAMMEVLFAMLLSPVTLFSPVSSVTTSVLEIMLAFEFFIRVLNPVLPIAYLVTETPK